jgi:hypothetical protein
LSYNLFSGSSNKPEPTPGPISNPVPVPKVVEQSDPISIFLTDKEMLDSGLVFLKSVQYIYSFDVKELNMDTNKLKEKFKYIDKVSEENNISIENVRVEYSSKFDEIKLLPPVKKKTTSSQAPSKQNPTKPEKAPKTNNKEKEKGKGK